jgi:F0F1-type ATP synthase assembly protein I
VNEDALVEIRQALTVIYREMGSNHASIQRDLGTMSSQITSVERRLESGTKLMSEFDKRQDTLDQRVDSVASRQSWFAGAGTMVGMLIGYIIHQVKGGG